MMFNNIKFMREVEGCSEFVYLDSSGFPTIGIGHKLTRNELTSGKIVIKNEYIKYKDGLTEDQINNLTLQDLKVASDCVDISILKTIILNQNQYDALVSFCFNVGCGAFRGSTLRKLLNQGLYNEVPSQLKRWVHDYKGNIVEGLVNRRNKEIELWSKSVEEV
jgi:lysozyme